MIKSVVVLVFTALALCGCVLQSRTPLYDDRSGELVLGQTGGAALMSSWKDGAWVRDTGPVSIAIAGQHYEATADASTIALTFVKLQTPWFVLQAVEVNKPTVYMLTKRGIYDQLVTDRRGRFILLAEVGKNVLLTNNEIHP